MLVAIPCRRDPETVEIPLSPLDGLDDFRLAHPRGIHPFFLRDGAYHLDFLAVLPPPVTRRPGGRTDCGPPYDCRLFRYFTVCVNVADPFFPPDSISVLKV